MASVRGSDRLVKVTASCGHITMTTVHGSGNGPVSRRNISENKNQPCRDCQIDSKDPAAAGRRAAKASGE